MKSFYLSDHQGKGRAYAAALEQAGYRRTEALADPDLALVLFDHDVAASGHGWREGLAYLKQRNVPVLMYPHAARPPLQWDGMYPIWPETRAFIAIAPGHRAVMAAFGYPKPVEICGWTLCEQRPFVLAEIGDQPVEVLFGLQHPNRNGYLHPLDKAANAAVYQLLLLTPGIRLTVRHIYRLDLSGLWSAPGVKYVLGTPNGTTQEIDQADVVVGHQTFAFLAAARGKPLVMFGDNMTPHSGNRIEVMRWAASYEQYRELLRYPLETESAASGAQMRNLIDRAISEDAGATWRKKFIGRPMDPKKFVTIVEKYL